MYVRSLLACLVPTEAGRGCWISWNWSCGAPCGCWELNTGASAKSNKPLTSEPPRFLERRLTTCPKNPTYLSFGGFSWAALSLALESATLTGQGGIVCCLHPGPLGEGKHSLSFQWLDAHKDSMNFWCHVGGECCHSFGNEEEGRDGSA